MMSNNKVPTQSGERLTFIQLFNEKGYNIEIPIIQRDYAQGRESAFEVRNLFLDALFEYLDENLEHRDLDFIYGTLLNGNSKDETKFIPLDGQQRLTTLFLLHWYLATKDGKLDELQAVLIKNNKSRFTYETRASSGEFCDSLLSNNINLSALLPADEHKNNSLSKTIQDSYWYFLSWGNDPTIKAMLIMLDAIHLKFQDTSGFFNRLSNLGNPVITFQFLNLEEFQLTDDLYIKMNARGKPLTPFENFKAKFEQLIKKMTFTDVPKYKLLFNDSVETVSIMVYFSHKIDIDWANLFWNYRDKKDNIFDEKLMNFIRATAINHYSNFSTDNNINKNVNYLIDRRNEVITFQRYIGLRCFDEKFTTDLIEILDLLKNGDEKAKKYLPNYFYFDEEEIFRKVIDNSFDNFTQRIQFYAYCQYLILWKSSDGLEEWMRIIHNLSENTIYNSEEDFIRSIKSVSRLLPESKNIIKYFSDNLPVTGFNGQQIQEERIKVSLIEKDDQWKNAIYDIEQHEYFKGQIEFVLKFSEIIEYYQGNSGCNWTAEEDSNFLNSFNNYAEKAKSVFDANGLKDFAYYLWERALLTKGDYLLFESRNLSFLINGKDRDISWKRLLLDGGKRDDRPNHEMRRNYVKEIFDDPYFDQIDIENSLKNIIEESKDTIDGWRKYFIAIPDIFNYLGAKRYIRLDEYSNNIYLLKKERLSGTHAELYTYAFFIKYLKDKVTECKPFSNICYYDVNGYDENDKPCILINEWHYYESEYEINIRYLPSGAKFEILFLDRKGKTIPKEIIDILNSLNFTEYKGNSVFVNELLAGTNGSLLLLIKAICTSFKQLTL
jgi:hypothetical protein